jgi:hypothetical protein
VLVTHHSVLSSQRSGTLILKKKARVLNDATIRSARADRPAFDCDLFLERLRVTELRFESCESVDEAVPRRDRSVTEVNLDGVTNEITERTLVQQRQTVELTIQLDG